LPRGSGVRLAPKKLVVDAAEFLVGTCCGERVDNPKDTEEGLRLLFCFVIGIEGPSDVDILVGDIGMCCRAVRVSGSTTVVPFLVPASLMSGFAGSKNAALVLGLHWLVRKFRGRLVDR
jgi:hypothetical protein